MRTNPNSGIVSRPSAHSVDQTVRLLKEVLEKKGIMLFAIIDHSELAQRSGSQMPNTKLLIFGNPKAGTPIMLAAPSAAIDLPLKILVAEDTSGGVYVSYNSPDYLQSRHEFPLELTPNIAAVEGIVGSL